MKKIFVGIIAVVLVATCGMMVACDNQKYDYTVGISQFVEHPALDKANKGFQDELTKLMSEKSKTVKYLYKNASKDIPTCTTIANSFITKNVDLMLTIATPAATAAAPLETNIPILFTAVTDPADPSVALVESKEVPGGHISGTSDLSLGVIDKQVELMAKLVPGAKTFGVLYATSETNSKIQVDLVEAKCAKMNIKLIKAGINDLTELKSKMASLKNSGVEAIYIPTDNVLANGASTVHSTNADEYKIPIICGETDMNKICGVATYGVDYYKLGQKTAQMAFDILFNHADISKMPVGYIDDVEFTVNEVVASAIGFKLSDEILALLPKAVA